MVIMEDEDMKVGNGSGDAEAQRYIRIASALQDRLRDARAGAGFGDTSLVRILENAAEEFGIETEDQDKRMKRRKESMEKSMVRERVKRLCTHSCMEHKEPINPKLWENLPQELLQLVVARLPVDKIVCLQFLSKEWQQTITTGSLFHQAFSEASPKLLCLITKSKDDLCWVRVLDLKRSKWYVFEIVAGHPAVDWTDCYAKPHTRPTMTAECEDGGLVCFVTEWNRYSKTKNSRPSLYFSVVNPLMRISRQLPPLFDVWKMQLVQIQMDRKTKEFKVFVLAQRCVWTNQRTGWIGNIVATHVYDSLTGEWTTVPCDGDFDERERLTFHLVHGQPMVARDTVDGVNYLRLAYSKSYDQMLSARYKERLYVLQMGSDGQLANEESHANRLSTFYIEEFHWECSVWVKVKTHRDNHFEHPPKTQCYMNLSACNGILMVWMQIFDGTASIFAEDRFYRKHLVWFIHK